MISKAKARFIKSLQVKKYRLQEQCFLVEGAKSVAELLRSSFEVKLMVATPAFLERNFSFPDQVECIEVTESQLAELGSLQANDSVLAVARMKKNEALTVNAREYALALDDIRDPGNLGTIIRTADWYGITKIIASEETADYYNPKTISATMGSFCRVQVFYTHLSDFLATVRVPVYGTFLEGAPVHGFSFAPQGVLVIGNEARGISDEVKKCIHTNITIPRFGGAESLNAGVAAAVVLDNLRRSQK